MVPAFVLALREGVEAALIIGIVLGAVKKMLRPELGRAVWLGTAVAAFLSILAALGLDWLGTEFSGPGEAIFEGFTLLLAASVLTWMIFWMRNQSRSIKGELEAGVQRAMGANVQRGIFILSFTAVLREGIELALFLAATTLTSNPVQSVSGALLGLGAAVLLGWSLFASLLRLDLRRFFNVTGILLVLFAAGLVAHSVSEFNEVGWIPGIIGHVWDLSPILSESTFVGQVLSVLFGYSSSPSLTQVLAYFLYFAVICLVFLRWRLASALPQKA